MNRRNALKNLGLCAGRILLFPSCDFSDEKANIVLTKLSINSDQESLLNSIVDAILPEDDTPGGLFVKAHNFIWVYIDECTSEKDQQRFISGLNDFMTLANKKLGKKFAVYPHKERLAFLESNIQNSENNSIKGFLKTTKKLAVLCYMNS